MASRKTAKVALRRAQISATLISLNRVEHIVHMVHRHDGMDLDIQNTVLFTFFEI